MTGVSDDARAAFATDVREALRRGARHKTPGFGTFTTCSRKAIPGRPACIMAMFRADAPLRAHVLAEGAPPPVDGPHAPAVGAIIEAMQREDGVDVVQLGHFAVVRDPGKKPRLIFHATKELNDTLTFAKR